MFVHRQQVLFLSEYVDDIKMAVREQNIMVPVWKKLIKFVVLGEFTTFLDHENLGCTQRECKPNETIVEQYTKMFESRNPTGATEKLPGGQSHAQIGALSHDMEGHAQKCIDRYCELVIKKVEQLYKVSSLCLDDHQFKQEELESVGELTEVCSHILEMFVFGTNWTIWHIVVSKQACKISLEMDSGMWRKMSKADFLLHHTIDYRQCCQVENTAQHCRLGLFQDSDFVGDFEDSKSTSGGILSLCVLSQRGPEHATSI